MKRWKQGYLPPVWKCGICVLIVGMVRHQKGTRTMKVAIYSRVSTQDQNTDNEVVQLEAYAKQWNIEVMGDKDG